MSPLPIAAAAAGAVKGKTAVQMAAFAKSMNKTDWDGVNNAMQSIKDFGASASVVQETMGDIKDMGQDLVDLALGELMAKLAGKASELFDALEPFATLLGELTSNIDLSKLDQFITNIKVFNILMENLDRVLGILFGWLVPILEWLLGADFTPPPTGEPPREPQTTSSYGAVLFDEGGY